MPADRDPPRPPRVEDDLDDYDDLPPGAHRPPPTVPRHDGRGRVVHYRNGAALAAYYLGVFGLIPILGFVFGPLALILGIIGLVKARQDPQGRGTGHSIAGIVLGIIDPPLWFVLWYFLRREFL